MTSNISFKFLGSLAGNECYLEGNDGKQTYSRKYDSLAANDLRRRVSKQGKNKVSGFKTIGQEYSYTPNSMGNSGFGTKPGTMQGGGFFFTLKTYKDDDQERFLTCFAYALGTFGERLEKVVHRKMKVIQESVPHTIDHIVKDFFTNVDTPEDGDLVIYSFSAGQTNHAGIYRNSKPNWNSPEGGTIESKWGWLTPYVFQHDVFFTPDFYGDTVKFYRLKKV
jgi:hypothetical protein